MNTVVPLTIEQSPPVGRPAPWTDRTVADGFDRAVNFIRTRTLDFPKPGAAPQPSWVSPIPNTFTLPETPQGNRVRRHRREVLDGAHSSALTRRWSSRDAGRRGAFGNVCLWTRYMQTYDYAHRPVSRIARTPTLDQTDPFG